MSFFYSFNGCIILDYRLFCPEASVEVKNIIIMDWFLTNTQLFIKVSCALIVDCDVLSAVLTPILMAPIHCRGCIAEQVM